MRVHRLALSAFGPFGGSEVIDFDELNESGIFLLTGPTGAGKTSILDAICFGLYGAVPGVRNNAKDLKSHHAAPRDQPVVELEVTLRDRRFRLRRTPAWRRPSSRAKVGYIDQNASVQAAELVDGEWVPRGSRLDEVGLLITRVLGMSKEQFCQVVMLPQGQFETFLRSGAKERHDVLEALFQTGRFQQIEKWLGEHRRQCEHNSRAHEEQIQLLLARIEEANGARWYDEQASPHDAAAALAAHLTSLQPACEDLRLQFEQATSTAKDREHAYSEAELLSKRQTELAEALRQADELDSLVETVQRRELEISHARLADKLSPQLGLLDEAIERRDTLAQMAGEALNHAVSSGALPSAETAVRDFDARGDALRTRVAELKSAGVLDEALGQARHQLADLETALPAVAASLAEAQESLKSIPDVLAVARVDLDRATTDAARLEAMQLRHRDATKAHDAACELPKVQVALGVARDTERAAHERHLDARSTLVDIREARIASMAAHLASKLSSGDECPVCGSHEHPRLAEIDAAHITEADESAAARAAQETADSHAAARAVRTELERSVTDLTAAALGIDEPTAMAAVVDAAAAVEAARQSRADAAELQTRIIALEAELHASQSMVSERAQSKARLESRLQHQQTTVAGLEARRAVLLPEGGSVEAAREESMRQLAGLDRWRRVTTELSHAQDTAAKQQSAFERQLLASEFDDVAALRSAVMNAPEIAAAEALNRTYAERRAVVAERLRDPYLLGAAQADPPDLDALREAVAAALGGLQEVSERYRAAQRRHERLLELADQLDEALARWEPLRAARDLAVEVAALCAGTSPDNQTRTKLSHYVLSARLQQVVDAANIRLLSIASGRYQLLHTMHKGVGDTRGGLGLRALDTYTGQERDPATLSGGETFYVSLALALGLADLVRDEIGGTELSTLFVDEGFGSLDADTLDEVLDEVDSLRSGGRSVGLVSHLSELRRRIPTQVRIVCTPHGSQVSPN